MNKVFILTSGEYSDYHIVAVFSTKEKAKDFILKFRNYNESDIEEYELDLGVEDLKNKNCYFLRMNKNGDTVYIEKQEEYYLGIKDYEQFDLNGNMYITYFAKDEKHAVKIANEKRMFLIANNKWNPEHRGEAI